MRNNDLNVFPLDICKFFENRRKKGHNILMGVNNKTGIYREIVGYLESKQRIFPLCVLRHGTQHFHSCYDRQRMFLVRGAD